MQVEIKSFGMDAEVQFDELDITLSEKYKGRDVTLHYTDADTGKVKIALVSVDGEGVVFNSFGGQSLFNYELICKLSIV